MAKYYVSPDGNNSWTGLTDSAPFATLEHAHSRTNVTEIAVREDFVQFGFIPQNAGTLESPILFTSYGLGVFKPTITGRKKLEGWTSIGDGLYKVTDSGFLDRVKFLLFDGELSTVATYPRDREYNQITGGSGNATGTIQDTVNLSGKNFTGGEVVTKKLAWCVDTMQITNHTGSTLTFTGGSSTYDVTVGWGYFVQNHRDCCTQLGDWCQEGDDIVMYFGSEDPSGYTIYAPYLQRVYFNNHGNNQFHGFRFEMFNGGSDWLSENPCILTSVTQNIKFYNCDFEFMGNTVFYHLSNNNNGFTVEGGTVRNCLNLFYWNRHSSTTKEFEINDVYFENIGHIKGSGGNGSIGYSCIVFSGETDGALLQRNRFNNIGYNAINYAGYGYLIKNNYAYNCCAIKDDGGPFYTFGKNDIAKVYDRTKRIVEGNIAIDCLGSNDGKSNWFTGTVTNGSVEAFYLDDDSNEITLRNNIAINCNTGARLNNTQNLDVTGNLFLGNKRTQVTTANSTRGTYKSRNILFTNNILYAESGQLVLELESMDTDGGNPTDLSLLGNWNNNYYMRPSNESGIIKVIKTGSGASTWFFSLQEWKESVYNHDANTKGTPTTSTVYEIALNDTLEHIIYPLERIRLDPDGLHINEPFGLGTFTAKLLLDDLGPIVPVPVEEYTVTVIAGTGGSVTGGGTYIEDDEATLTATPDTGWHFVRWSNDVTDNPYTFTVTGDVTLQAIFDQDDPSPGVIVVKGKFRIV